MIKKTKIKNLRAKEILDSRQNPTVEVEIETNKGKFSASVPSGASKGEYEALELRDKDAGVKTAIKNVNKIICPKLIGKDPVQQREIDKLMIDLDGTENKSKLGANAILAVSIAVCRAAAATEKLPLYEYISKLAGVRHPLTLPQPCFNFINGGKHAEKGLDIQEFMVIPQKKSFAENLAAASRIFQNLKEILIKNYGETAIKLGDEGGFVPPISNAQQALFLLKNASENNPEIKFALDCAASQFYKEGKYHLEGKELTRSGLLDFYKELINTFPIIFIEDPYGQDDWEGFKEITKELGKKIDIFGDDLLATNIKRIKEAHSRNACTGAIIKPNQIGTVTETIEAAKLAKSFEWKIMVSHRSGETLDDFIADLAVGVGAEFIKAGASSKEERMVKYNRLVKIEQELKNF